MGGVFSMHWKKEIICLFGWKPSREESVQNTWHRWKNDIKMDVRVRMSTEAG
jgi:hypothetical protein